MPPSDLFTPFSWPYWINVGTAILCGGVLGLNRQLRGKPAGLRTCIIVVLATDTFVVLSQVLTPDAGDPSRVLAGVISGVGFLGAGVILARRGRVEGVTTAAIIWMLAAVGAEIGLGQYAGAIATTFIVVAIVNAVDFLEDRGPLQKKEFEPEKDQL
jgi:putative Mg2+ transporter-C (MgtC) family protein